MKVEQQQVGTVSVLAPVGPLVDPEAAHFSKLLRGCAGAPGSRVVVSLHEVPYLDSAAIEGLLDTADEMIHRASSLKLVAVPATCREILELTGVAGRFTFFKDVQDAVRSFL